MECLAVFLLLPYPPSTVYQCDGCCLLGGVGAHGWVVSFNASHHSAVSILELATNSESSRMSQASNFHLTMQLL